MRRPGLILYGATAYVLFNIVFLYMIGFLLDFLVPKAINDGQSGPVWRALAINTGLIFLFGFFHSLMARAKFKEIWTKVVPVAAERSTYVLQSAVFLGVAMVLWQPMTTVLWSLDGHATLVAYGVCGLGVCLVLLSTFLIDHFELFGLRQVWMANAAKPMPKPEFRTPLLYRFVRHPMQFGIILVFFGTPHMTTGHLLFAGLMSLYVLIGLWFEERALVRDFGDAYRNYQRDVPMLLPRLVPVHRTQSRSQNG